MTPDRDRLSLHAGMSASGMDYHELWLRHLAVSGDATEFELEAYLLGLLRPDPFQYNLIAQAINEHFVDQGQNHPVGYWDPANTQ
jgi:hypothetical protein